MEFRIEKGRGYRLVEKGIDEASIDFLSSGLHFYACKKG